MFLGVTVTGLDVDQYIGLCRGTKKAGLAAVPAGGRGLTVPTPPGADHGVPVADECQRESQQLGRQPVQRIGDVMGSAAAARVELQRVIACQRLREPVQQRADRAEQKEPQQHGEASAQCGVGDRHAQRGCVPGDRRAIVGQRLRRGLAADAIRSPQDRFQVGLEFARTEAVEQYGQRKQQLQQSAQRSVAEYPPQQRTQHCRQQQGQHHATAATGVRQLRHPAAKQAVATPACELRHDMQQAKGDEGSKQTDGHDGMNSQAVGALYARDHSFRRPASMLHNGWPRRTRTRISRKGRPRPTHPDSARRVAAANTPVNGTTLTAR